MLMEKYSVAKDFLGNFFFFITENSGINYNYGITDV